MQESVGVNEYLVKANRGSEQRLASVTLLTGGGSRAEAQFTYHEHTSTHAQGTDPRVALGA